MPPDRSLGTLSKCARLAPCVPHRSHSASSPYECEIDNYLFQRDLDLPRVTRPHPGMQLARAKLIRWMVDCAAQLRIDTEAVEMSVVYLDRFNVRFAC